VWEAGQGENVREGDEGRGAGKKEGGGEEPGAYSDANRRGDVAGLALPDVNRLVVKLTLALVGLPSSIVTEVSVREGMMKKGERV